MTIPKLTQFNKQIKKKKNIEKYEGNAISTGTVMVIIIVILIIVAITMGFNDKPKKMSTQEENIYALRIPKKKQKKKEELKEKKND